MEKLPQEILEYILCLLPPYQDLSNCKLVCKYWHATVLRVVRRRQFSLHNALREHSLVWEKGQMPEAMARRNLTSVCIYEGMMYLYGGQSDSATTFNELYALDLATRKWIRHFPTGDLPPPKAAASLCGYRGKLILSGGICPPANLFPHQDFVFFKQIHSYDLAERRWTMLCNDDVRVYACLPGATIHGNLLVLVGGCPLSVPTIAEWPVNVFNLDTLEWIQPQCDSIAPPVVMVLAQIYLDQYHLLLVLNNPPPTAEGKYRMSFWVLSMERMPWTWREIQQVALYPGATTAAVFKVGHMLVSFGYADAAEDDSPKKEEEEDDSHKDDVAECERYMPFHKNLTPSERKKRQLAVLEAHVKKYSKHKKRPAATVKRPNMVVQVADFCNIVEKGQVTWREPRFCHGPVKRTSPLVRVGNSEIVMLDGRNTSARPIHELYYASAAKEAML